MWTERHHTGSIRITNVERRACACTRTLNVGYIYNANAEREKHKLYARRTAPAAAGSDVRVCRMSARRLQRTGSRL